MLCFIFFAAIFLYLTLLYFFSVRSSDSDTEQVTYVYDTDDDDDEEEFDEEDEYDEFTDDEDDPDYDIYQEGSQPETDYWYYYNTDEQE